MVGRYVLGGTWRIFKNTVKQGKNAKRTNGVMVFFAISRFFFATFGFFLQPGFFLQREGFFLQPGRFFFAT